MKALRNLLSLFKNRRNKVKSDAMTASGSPHVKAARTELKRKKGNRTFILRNDGTIKGRNKYAHGGCRARGGRMMSLTQNRINQEKRAGRSLDIRVSSLTLNELLPIKGV